MPLKNNCNNLCSLCKAHEKSVFHQLEKGAAEKLSREMVSNSYKKGQALFHQGNPPFGLYCISSGRIKVIKTDSDANETILRIASAGDLIGHRSLFCDSLYSASAVVLEDADVCFIKKSAIFDLIRENPTVAIKIMGYLSEGMGSAENKLASLAQRSVRERFAELLLLLKKSYGVHEDGMTKLEISLTRKEMASMMGTSSEGLIRLITEFKNDNIIVQKRKTIFLTDEDKLAEYANLIF